MAQRTWLITGANRGLGFLIARQALATGDRVAATARNPDGLAEALGGDVLALPLDVTDPGAAQAAVERTRERFGRLDVLVNNAGYGQFGPFEEVSHALFERQFATNLWGAMHVTRAALPVMRAQGHGRILNMSSIAGLAASAGGSAYNASKFALEGWSEALALDLAPFGIRVTLIEPGFVRTDFLDASSVRFGDREIADYAPTRERQRAFMQGRNHVQPGDPEKVAALVLRMAGEENPPLRILAGSDALGRMRDRLAHLAREVEAWADVSAATDIEAPEGSP
jgi:NAD(P)-dependent dehydrogenase (short-subunit alcohol dehydrogenase family)